jgi:hypothetical protein
LSSGIAIQTNLPTHHSDQHTDYHSDHYEYDDRQIDHHQSQLGNDEYFEAYKAWSHPPDPVYKEIVPSYKEVAPVVPGYSNPEPDGVTPLSTIYYGDTLAPKGRGLLYNKQLLCQCSLSGWIRIGASLDPDPDSCLLYKYVLEL